MSDRLPLIAVVGATATGKSDVAVAIAEAIDGEVLSADAYQVYRGMDIGTAKASPALQSRVPHHLIDIAEPSQPLTLATYLDIARQALAEVQARGRVAVLAGGSGQYIWALLEGWQVPRVEPDPALRAELEALLVQGGVAALTERLAALDPEAAATIDVQNPRRVIRAIEVVSCTGRPLAACQTRIPPNADVLVIGLHMERGALHARLDARTDAMYAAGFVAEVERLRAAGYGEARPVRDAVGYREASQYLDGACTLPEAIEQHKLANHRLVRRQNAWFKPGDPRICWLPAEEDISAAALSLVHGWRAELRLP